MGTTPVSFPLGQTVATPGALEWLADHELTPFHLLARHARGDFGDLMAADVQANLDALKHGGRIFSSYIVGGDKVWVITEADRSSTCVLMASEY